MQSWFNYAKQLMSHIQPMITPFFEHTGPERTTPSCPVKLVPDFNPSAGVQSYLESDEDCTEPAKYFIPFFNDNSGPRYEEVSTNGHESRPGHHLQVGREETWKGY